MKRFYKNVSVAENADGFSILLDGKPVRTPLKNALIVEKRALADAIAAEWDAQNNHIAPQTMPMTALANTLIDKVRGGARAAMTAEILRHADADPVFYRHDAPDTLTALQQQRHGPVWAWLEREWQVEPVFSSGVSVSTQTLRYHQIVAAYVADMADEAFTGFQAAVAALESVILALAVLRGVISAEAACAAAFLEEEFQLNQWGKDEEAEARLELARQDMRAVRVWLDRT